MPPRKNRSKRKKPAPPPTQTEEQIVVAKPSTKNDAPPQNPPSDDSKSEGQMSVIHVTYVTIIWSYERTVRIYTLLQTELSLKGLDTNTTTRTEHR